MRVKIKARKIYLSFRPVQTVESIVIENGVVVGTGHYSTSSPGDGNEVVDLGNSIVMPGFVDSHMHLDELGRSLAIIDLRGAGSVNEFRERVRSGKGSEGWITGHGWDQDLFEEQRWPTRDDLDDITGERPAIFSRVDLHSAVLNTRAIELLDLEERFRDSPDLIRDENGRITGVVTESVFEFSEDQVIQNMSDGEWKEYISMALEEALRNGVTSVGFVSCSLRILRLLLEIRRENLLKIRVHAYIHGSELKEYNGLPDDEFLQVKGIKLFADGSLGSRTAFMSFEYSDDRGNSGMERETRESILEYGLEAERRGLHIATHAIGDRAIDNVLWAYERLEGKHRIDHASLIRPDQYDKIRKTGSLLVMQPHFIITDFWTDRRIGMQNLGMAYPLKNVMDYQIEEAFSTDCPVERLNPWETVQAAVTRGSEMGNVLGANTRNQCVGIPESLWMYTECSARAVRNGKIGILKEGLAADFIVLDRDPMETENADLSSIKVLQSWVAGSIAWSHDSP